MDQIWKAQSLDLHLNPYQVVSTGANTGLIQVLIPPPLQIGVIIFIYLFKVVPDSCTLADIHKEYGGVTAAVMSSTSLVNWLKATDSSEDYEKKVF